MKSHSYSALQRSTLNANIAIDMEQLHINVAKAVIMGVQAPYRIRNKFLIMAKDESLSTRLLHGKALNPDLFQLKS